MQAVYLLIGGNLGNRVQSLAKARQRIGDYIGCIQQQSNIYETQAWGVRQQPNFLNQVLVIQTELLPYVILQIIQEIEQEIGRKRLRKWGERLIDIDILFYENSIIESERLTIPHPHLHQRRFTLVPLVELQPNLVHPLLKKNMTELLQECSDELAVWQYQEG